MKSKSRGWWSCSNSSFSLTRGIPSGWTLCYCHLWLVPPLSSTSDSSMERAASMMERMVSLDARLPPADETLVGDGMGIIWRLEGSSLLLLLLSLWLERREVGLGGRRCSKSMMQFFLQSIAAEETPVLDTLHYIDLRMLLVLLELVFPIDSFVSGIVGFCNTDCWICDSDAFEKESKLKEHGFRDEKLWCSLLQKRWVNGIHKHWWWSLLDKAFFSCWSENFVLSDLCSKSPPRRNTSRKGFLILWDLKNRLDLRNTSEREEINYLTFMGIQQNHSKENCCSEWFRIP